MAGLKNSKGLIGPLAELARLEYQIARSKLAGL
jgi:hypothetical protein